MTDPTPRVTSEGEQRPLLLRGGEQGINTRLRLAALLHLAGNLASQSLAKGCPRGTTYTVNDAQQITAKNGSTTNWSYDRIGNETAAPTPESTRTGITWSDHSQMTSIPTGGKTYAGQYGSTDQSERIKPGGTFFHNTPLGLSTTSTAVVETGFNREPGAR
ncbi:hypothetical protein [Streptomyces californicus]|uniref:hypothetical protein n=1 Tax=Streptomyces californicus TaxID=67351 RepID=UPI00379E38A8